MLLKIFVKFAIIAVQVRHSDGSDAVPLKLPFGMGGTARVHCGIWFDVKDNRSFLYVKLLQLVDVPIMDDNGLTDPFLKLYLLTTVHEKAVCPPYTSSIYKETLTVEFDDFEVASFPYTEHELDHFVLLIDLYDWDQTSNEYIGQAVIGLKDLKRQTRESGDQNGILRTWIELPDTDYYTKFHQTSIFSRLKAYKRHLKDKINKELSFKKKGNEKGKKQNVTSEYPDLREQIGVVAVRVLEGKDIGKSGHSRRGRFYVEIVVEDKCKHTTMAENVNDTLRWHENRDFELTDITTDVVLRVFDSDQNFVGHCIVPLSRLLTPFGPKPPKSFWLELYPQMVPDQKKFRGGVAATKQSAVDKPPTPLGYINVEVCVKLNNNVCGLPLLLLLIFPLSILLLLLLLQIPYALCYSKPPFHVDPPSRYLPS